MCLSAPASDDVLSLMSTGSLFSLIVGPLRLLLLQRTCIESKIGFYRRVRVRRDMILVIIFITHTYVAYLNVCSVCVVYGTCNTIS